MINPRNSHAPLPDDRRKRCPICHQRVYSSAGIHPQCAIKQPDPWLTAAVAAQEAPPVADVGELRVDPPAPTVKANPKVKDKPRPALTAKRVKQA